MLSSLRRFGTKRFSVASTTHDAPLGVSPAEEKSSAGASVGRWVRRGLAAWLPALPLFLIAGSFLFLPTIQIVYQSLHNDEVGWTVQFWRDTFESRGGRESILTSLRLGFFGATICLIVGGPLAWIISRMVTASRSFWLALMNVAANFGGIGLAFGYVAALGTYGMVTLALSDIGIDFTPPQVGTFESLLIAYQYSNVPLFVLLTLPAMSILRNDWMEAAAVSAASKLQFWRYIGLPILAPFLLAGWLLIFTWTIGIYGLAYALGANASAAGQLRLITLYIGLFLNTSAGREERASVMAALLLLMAAVSLITYRLILKWALRWFN